jgi:hypothetical protein
VESQSLTDAAEALDQGRNEDAIAFLREAVRDAEPNGDEETLVAVVGLARRIPGPEAQELVARLSEATLPGAVPRSSPGS